MFKSGQRGIIKWTDGTTSKVIISHIEVYSWLPADYWLEYDDSETNRPLNHPDYGVNPIIKSPILLPEGLFYRFFQLEIDPNSYEGKLKKYIEDNFRQSEQFEAETALKRLEQVAGRDYIINKYLN